MAETILGGMEMQFCQSGYYVAPMGARRVAPRAIAIDPYINSSSPAPEAVQSNIFNLSKLLYVDEEEKDFLTVSMVASWGRRLKEKTHFRVLLRKSIVRISLNLVGIIHMARR